MNLQQIIMSARGNCAAHVRSHRKDHTRLRAKARG